MSSPHEKYHLGELAVASSPNDPRRLVPEIPAGCRRVLDVGCGAGQTLTSIDLKGAFAVGLDFEMEALQVGRKIGVAASFICSSGETLPFRSESFDFVFSRVALPYMDLSGALKEMSRVLRPGGEIWITLHPLAMLSWKKALSGPKPAAFEAYRLANTALLHFTGKQFRYPLRRNRNESYQTPAGMRRLLRKVGFENIRITLERHFLITARKPQTS